MVQEPLNLVSLLVPLGLTSFSRRILQSPRKNEHKLSCQISGSQEVRVSVGKGTGVSSFTTADFCSGPLFLLLHSHLQLAGVPESTVTVTDCLYNQLIFYFLLELQKKVVCITGWDKRLQFLLPFSPISIFSLTYIPACRAGVMWYGLDRALFCPTPRINKLRF